MNRHKLGRLELHAGMNSEGKPYVTISAFADNQSVMLMGQLLPEQVRDLGVVAFDVADQADNEAIIINILTKHGLAPEMITRFLTEFREERET